MYLLIEFTICLLLFMFFRVEIDTGWTEWEKTLLILTEIENELFGVESTMFGLVRRFCHGKWNIL